MKPIILAAVLTALGACSTNKVDPLLLPPEHDAVPGNETGNSAGSRS